MNVAVLGAEPWAVVDNLNFGNPEDPGVMWQFSETIDGIASACEALGVPVVGGNVSFYNETGTEGIFPTPVIGMLGITDPVPASLPGLDRATEGLEIWLLGPQSVDIAGTAFDRAVRNHLGGRPVPARPSMGRSLVRAAISMAAGELAPVLHDVSAGGLITALAEICIRSRIGAVVAYSDWRELFSEGPHRLVVGIERESAPAVDEIAADADVKARRVGHFAGDRIVLVGGDAGEASVGLAEASTVWQEAIPRRVTRF